MSESTSPGGASLDHLRSVATNGSESDRIALARDPNTPDVILEILASDQTMLVRDFASKERRRRGGTDGKATKLPSYPPATPQAAVQGDGLQQRILHAQISTAMYLRAALSLAFTVLVSLGALQQGNAAEQRQALDCLDRVYCSTPGGEGWFLVAIVALIVGTIITIVLMLVAGSRLGKATK